MSTGDRGYLREHGTPERPGLDPGDRRRGRPGLVRPAASLRESETDERRDVALDPADLAGDHPHPAAGAVRPQALIHAAYSRRPEVPGDWAGIATLCGEIVRERWSHLAREMTRLW